MIDKHFDCACFGCDGYNLVTIGTRKHARTQTTKDTL